MIVEYTRHDINRDCRFLIRPGTSDENAIKEVFKKNSYQRKSFKVEPGERWLDMGSNIGAFSVFALSKGCDVVSFEAENENAKRTRYNIDLNGYEPKVVNCAIVPDEYRLDHVNLHVSSRPMAKRRHSIGAHKKDFELVPVRAIRFSDALKMYSGHRCLKMNIEGVEIDILKSRVDLSGVDKLVLEWSFDKDPMISTLTETLAWLRTEFKYVDINKRIPDSEKWEFYPPNAFIYAMRL